MRESWVSNKENLTSMNIMVRDKEREDGVSPHAQISGPLPKSVSNATFNLGLENEEERDRYALTI